jgi:nucleoside-diphosphate-sugar epimerase
MATIFLTGATGFIGQTLLQRFLDDGHQVKALYRKDRPTVEGKVEWIQGDITKIDGFAAALVGCSYVVHAAAYAKPWAPSREVFFDINTAGTLALATVAIAAGATRFLFVSTAGVFGPSVDDKITDELTPKNTLFYTDYEASKAVAEKKLRILCDGQIELIIVNPTRVYGPGLLAESNSVTKLADQYQQGKFRFLPGDGRSIGNYVYVTDVVEGIFQALWKGANGEQYLLAGENTDFVGLFGHLAQLTGKNYRMFHFPLPLMLFGARAMTLWADWTGRAPAITPPFVVKYSKNWLVSNDKMTSQLGISPKGLQEGLRLTLDWLVQKT